MALLCGGNAGGVQLCKDCCCSTRVAAPVALVVCLTLICTILLSQLIGGILPVAAEKLHVDPAVMASPLITTIVDTTTLLVYFNIAKGTAATGIKRISTRTPFRTLDKRCADRGAFFSCKTGSNILFRKTFSEQGEKCKAPKEC